MRKVFISAVLLLVPAISYGQDCQACQQGQQQVRIQSPVQAVQAVPAQRTQVQRVIVVEPQRQQPQQRKTSSGGQSWPAGDKRFEELNKKVDLITAKESCECSQDRIVKIEQTLVKIATSLENPKEISGQEISKIADATAERLKFYARVKNSDGTLGPVIGVSLTSNQNPLIFSIKEN